MHSILNCPSHSSVTILLPSLISREHHVQERSISCHTSYVSVCRLMHAQGHINIKFSRSASFFCGLGLKPPLGPFFRSPRFRFLRSLCSSPLGPYKSQHCGHIGLFCILRMVHEGDCGVIGGTNDDCKGNRSTRRKPAPAPLCPTTNPT
jgi:hypothetical protein